MTDQFKMDLYKLLESLEPKPNNGVTALYWDLLYRIESHCKIDEVKESE